MFSKMALVILIGVFCLGALGQETKQVANQKTRVINLGPALKNKKRQEGSKVYITRGGLKFVADVSKGKLVNWQATDSKGELHSVVFNNCHPPRPLRLCCATIEITYRTGSPPREVTKKYLVTAECDAIQ